MRILCFGDSNTWGYTPQTGIRYERAYRWPRVMQEQLQGAGHTVEVVEEGLNGRTTVWEDQVDGVMSGLAYLPPCLASHKPLDWVVLMLGTNDLKARFNMSAWEIARSAGRLVRLIQQSASGPEDRAPKILLLAPPPIVTPTLGFGVRRYEVEISSEFSTHFAEVADEHACAFFDAGEVVQSSPIDGIHLSCASQVALGQAVAAKLEALEAA